MVDGSGDPDSSLSHPFQHRLHWQFAFIIAMYRLALNLLTACVLCLSVWVGIDGAIYGSKGLGICITNGYKLETLCHYTIYYSVLWHPFFDQRLSFQPPPLVAGALRVLLPGRFCILRFPSVGNAPGTNANSAKKFCQSLSKRKLVAFLIP